MAPRDTCAATLDPLWRWAATVWEMATGILRVINPDPDGYAHH